MLAKAQSARLNSNITIKKTAEETNEYSGERNQTNRNPSRSQKLQADGIL